MSGAALPTVLDASREEPGTEAYFWQNRNREPRGRIVIQRTIRGEGLLEETTGVHPVRENQVMVFVYGENTSYRIGPPETRPYHLSFIVVEPSGGIAEIVQAIRNTFGSVLRMDAAGEAAGLHESIVSTFISQSDLDSLLLSELAYRLLISLYREQVSETAGSDPVAYLRHLLQSRFREPRNISQWTEELPLSREHLTRLFRERYGESPAVFLRRLRLQHAKLLRQSRHLSASDIARASGFASTETLRRAYRIAYGHSLSR